MNFLKNILHVINAFFLRNKSSLILFSVILLGTILRFTKLDWGDGYHFHPDEYHLVISANQIDFPNQMHPHFFSYGSITVYLIYLTNLGLKNLFRSGSDLFLVGRFYSAFFSSLTLVVIYLLARKLFKNIKLAILTVALVGLSPGLVQQAHFATPESAVTFWVFLFLLLSIKYIESNKFRYMFLSAISFGMAIGTKITPLITLPTFIFAVIYKAIRTKRPIYLISHIFPFVTTALLVYLAINPYTVLDYPGFRHSFNYETGVARGTHLVFYTRQFLDTFPLIFQYTKILPYTINPVSLILGTAGFLIILVTLFKQKPKSTSLYIYFSILLTFSTYFFSNCFMFAKWTRFIAPTFPFFSLFSVIVIDRVSNKWNVLSKFIIILITFSSITWSMMFFSVYTRSDVRTVATEWLNGNIPDGSYILTEAGNIIEVPLAGKNFRSNFEFYELEENRNLQQQLTKELEMADYFVIQSRRIRLNHNARRFPITANFYKKLVDGSLGFEKIKQFDSFPGFRFGKYKIIINDEAAEETWSVFDHPIIRVYKKTLPLNDSEYKKILKIY